MGRNKIKIEKIKNDRIRQVTFYKRKRGLLKKAMELSLLCDIKVFLCIVDKNEKMMIFTSEKEVDQFKNKYLDHYSEAREVFTHKDVKLLLIKKYNVVFKDYNSDSEKEIEEIGINKVKEDKLRTISGMSDDEKNINENKEKTKFFNSEKQIDSNLSSYKSEDGISKIKKKLSLKVVIPDNKNNFGNEKKSIDSEPKILSIDSNFRKNIIDKNEENSSDYMNVFKSRVGLKIDTKLQSSNVKSDNFNEPHPMTKGQLTPKNILSPNLNSLTENKSKIINGNNLIINLPSVQTPLPLSNPFQLNFDSFLISQKRYRDENYLNFSPNINTGIVKSFTPVRDYYSPNFPNIFMFNNSGTNTPLLKLPSNACTPNPIKIENNFDYRFNKNDSLTVNELSSTSENNITSNKSGNTINTSANSNNQPYNNIENVNIEIPNILVVSTKNSNLGFYTWLMQGPTQSKLNIDKKLKNLKKNKKNLKKFKESDESNEVDDSEL